MKPLPESITTALAAFSTGGAVTDVEERLRSARGDVHNFSHATDRAAREPTRAIQTYIRRRWNRRAPDLGYVSVRVTTSTDHRDNTSVPLVIVETTGYGLDRLTVSWSGHSAEALDAWVDRVAKAWAGLSVRPNNNVKEK